MLNVVIPPSEMWDERTQEFVSVKGATLQLEHSLVSLSKWESKWNKPFLSKNQKTEEEMNDYIRCMTITQNVDPDVYNHIPLNIKKQISEYINAPMTATWFSEEENKITKHSSEQTTSELIYYWMITANIPFECQKWHLNRLLTLIRVCSVKNRPQKNTANTKAAMSKRAALNAARQQKFNSRG